MPKLPDISSSARPTPSGGYQFEAPKFSAGGNGEGLQSFGKSLGKLGDELWRYNENDEKEKKKELNDRASRQASYAHINLSKSIIDFVNEKKDDPAYEKHIPDYQDFITKKTDEYALTIDDDKIREDFRVKAAQTALGGYESLKIDEGSKKKDADIYGTSLAADRAREIFLNAPNGQMRDGAARDFSDAIDKLPNSTMKESDKFAAKRKWLAETQESWLSSLPATEQVKVLEGISVSRKTALNPAAPKDFSQSVDFLLNKVEGSGYVANDGGKGPSKYGIVGSQNGLTPEQVRNLTPEQAKPIYKEKYWDAVGADSLPENVRLLAFDTAVNFGVDTAKKMLAQSANDPAALLRLRSDMHNDIATERPDTHGKYKEGWEGRDLLLESTVFKNAIPKEDKDTFGIPTDRVNKLLEKAKSEVEAEGVKSRSGLRLREEDAISMSMAGKENPSPVTFAEFQRAYPEDAEKRYDAHKATISFGADYNRALTMPVSQQAEMLSKYEPKAGEGFEAAQKMQESMAKAIAAANKSRGEDPMAFAMQSGIMPQEQLDFSSPDKVAQQLDSRVSISKEMSGKYGTPVAVFTKQEASQFAGLMESKDALSKLALLKSLKAGIKDGDAYSTAIQQIRKDSPVTALAGTYMAMGDKVVQVSDPVFGEPIKETSSKVALNILRGEELINPTKKDKQEGGTSAKGFPMPTDKYLRASFSDYSENLFAGQPEMNDTLFQAAKAYYAAEASDKGKYDGAFDSEIMRKAVKSVIGEKTEINGEAVAVPWGMDVYDFEKKAKSDFEAKKSAAGLTDKALSWDDVILRMRPLFGKFTVYNGNKAVIDKNGNELVVDVLSATEAKPATQGKKASLVNPISGVL